MVGGGWWQFHFIIFINENKPLTITIIDFFSSKTFKLFSLSSENIIGILSCPELKTSSSRLQYTFNNKELKKLMN